MNSPCCFLASGLVASLALAPAAWAQFSPRIACVYPAGGKQGASFEITVAGQFLTGATNVFVSGKGVKATVVEFNKPLSNRDFFLLQDKLKELDEQRRAAYRSRWNRNENSGSQTSTNATWTAEDEKQVAEIRAKIRKNPPNFNNRISPALAETVTIQVTLAPDAEPGERELRLESLQWLTNPLVFCVGQLPEFTEKEENKGPQTFFGGPQSYGPRPGSGANEPAKVITLPAAVNGRIMPGDVDRYRFTARQGQRLVVAAAARQLIPYIPDAVPGWFQATLALYDAKGKELAYDDDYRFNPDPVLLYEIPADGEYVIEIKDSIYRGREDFVYRITIGELPFVTSIFPLGGPAGAPTTVELKGWNLPAAKLVLNDKDRAPGVYPVSVRQGEWVSNLTPFAVDALPECLELNNSKGRAQRVSLPIIVNGRIDQPGDLDVFRFDGLAGAEIVAEVHARRLNSPVDSMLTLTDSSGKQLAINDDHADLGSGLNTHHADSYLRATLPRKGAYYLQLGDAQRKGGPEYAYRLRISKPQPDFALRVVPSSISARVGATIPITVHALRQDGFSGDISISLKDAPPGFSLGGGRVPAGQDKVRLTLTAPSVPQAQPINLHLEGCATIEGRAIVRAAVPADNMMQAFEYRHLVPAQELKVFVAGNYTMTAPAVRILGESPVNIPAGGTARVQISAPLRPFANQLQLELNEPPEGITIKNVSPSRDGREIVLQSDAAKVQPGLKGNLIINVFERNFGLFGKGKGPGNQQRRPLGTLPAIPFEVVKQ